MANKNNAEPKSTGENIKKASEKARAAKPNVDAKYNTRFNQTAKTKKTSSK